MYTPYHPGNAIHISTMYSLFTVHHPYGFTFDGEFHNFWECLFIRKGSLQASGNDRVYNLSVSDLIIHCPLELHKFTVTSPEGVDILIFSFNAVGAILNNIEKKAFHLNDVSYENAVRIIDCINTHKHMFPKNLNSNFPALDYMTQNAVFSQTILSYIYLLLISIEEEQSISPTSKSSSSIVFGDAVRYMENNIHENITIPQLSKVLGASPTNIQNAFIKHSGLSIHRYFVKLKINTAIGYLNQNINVTSLAELLGFSSQAHFTNTFKKETGLSPSAYRKLLSENPAVPLI